MYKQSFSAFLLNFRTYLPSLSSTGLTSSTFTWRRWSINSEIWWTYFDFVFKVHPREFSLEGFPFYFSVAIYCFEGAGMILSLEESLASEVGLIIVQYSKCTQAILMCGLPDWYFCTFLDFCRTDPRPVQIVLHQDHPRHHYALHHFWRCWLPLIRLVSQEKTKQIIFDSITCNICHSLVDNYRLIFFE